jgi:hypothetical protein
MSSPGKKVRPALSEPPDDAPDPATAKFCRSEASRRVIIGGVIMANRPQDSRKRRLCLLKTQKAKKA